MKSLIGKKVSAIADCGLYKDKQIEGVLSLYEETGQYLVKTDSMTISVKEKSIIEDKS